MKQRKTPWIILSIVSFAAYLWQSIRYAISLPVIIDEGAYLFKGLLYATGQYQPFQVGGPWTNKMPLAFLIPGWVQVIFGEGIRTGRIYAIIISVLTIAGVWFLVYRLKDMRWASISVLCFAVTSSILQNYSQVWSQGIIAMLIVWSLVFILPPDGKPKISAVIAGSVLAILTVMIRQNMVLYPVLFVIFIFWRDGKKTGYWALFISLSLLVIYHLIYFPEIMRLWLVWLPGFLQTYFEEHGIIFTPDWTWSPEYPFSARLDSIWLATRYHFIFVLGFLGTILFTPWKTYRKPDDHQKNVIFLLVTFVGLTAMHFYASIMQNYCIFCLNTYLDFFIVLIPPLVVLTIGEWKLPQKRLLQAITITAVIAIASFVIIDSIKDIQPLYVFFESPVPRMKNFKILEGTVPFSQILCNKLHIPDFDSYLECLYTFVHIAVILGVSLVTMATLLIARKLKSKFSPVVITFTLLFVFSLAFAPTSIFTTPVSPQTCGNVIENIETTGAYLNELIPDGSEVEWYASSTMLPLIYHDDIVIHPQKFNSPYGKRLSDDIDQLLAFGFYNDDLEQQWLAQSDYIIIEEGAYQSSEQAVQQLLDWEYKEETPSIPICENDKGTILHIFKKP